MKTTVRGKRSVLQHLNTINFDFNKYVDVTFKSMTAHFVPLAVALDILMMYLIEGNKILFRYTYAILKVNKKYIKNATNANDFLDGLAVNSKQYMDPKKLKKKAFAYPLKRSNYNFKKAGAGNLEIGNSEFNDYFPNCPLNSQIVLFEDFTQVWRMLPDYVKIRVPELIYCATTDGFNLQNLYRKCKPYKNEYKFSLILIQTN